MCFRRRIGIGVVVLAFAALTAARGGVVARTAGAGSLADGLLFLDGAYVPGPYRVEVRDGAVLINGREVRPPLAEPAPPPVVPPDDPQTAGDLLLAGMARLRELLDAGRLSLDTLDVDVRAEIAEMLRGYPAAAAVEEQGGSIVITDRQGEEAELELLRPPPPTPEEMLLAQAQRAADWQTALDSGGMLLVSRDVALDLPAARIPETLRALFDVFEQPEAERAAVLSAVIRDAGLVAELLRAGPPPAVLRPRAAARPALGAAAPAEGGAGKLLADDASHRQSRTPRTLEAYLFLSVSVLRAQVPIVRAAKLHGYSVYQYEPGTRCAPGSVTVANFAATSGRAAILYISAHGGPSGISLESHCSKAEAQAALNDYLSGKTASDLPIAPGDLSTRQIGSLFVDHYVRINSSLISKWRDANSIVQLSTCNGGYLGNAFRSREFIGPTEEIRVCGPAFRNGSLWDRIAGIKDTGTKRAVQDAYAASDFASTGIYLHRSEGPTVLSPAVARQSPAPGGNYRVGEPVTVTITFDTPMNQEPSRLNRMVVGEGACAPRVEPARWLDTRTVQVTWTPTRPGEAVFDLQSDLATSADNNNDLDGNQGGRGNQIADVTVTGLGGFLPLGNAYEKGTPHVDGNTDNHRWRDTCVAGSESGIPVTPTPATTPPRSAPTPTASPSPRPASGQTGLRLNPAQARPGAQVAYLGFGFTPGQPGELRIAGNLVAVPGVEASGEVRGTFLVPPLPPGTVVVTLQTRIDEPAEAMLTVLSGPAAAPGGVPTIPRPPGQTLP